MVKVYDIYFLWENREEKLKSFIDDINKMHPILKFKADWSKTSIKFLDVTVSIPDRYIKPGDSHQYLLLSSCHPFYCKQGMSYNHVLRYVRKWYVKKYFKRELFSEMHF